MWGSFNDRFTSVRSTLSKVAHDVMEQAEELAAPQPQASVHVCTVLSFKPGEVSLARTTFIT
eukprot:scaffold341348_cov38-Prasinocladus_malaysianus.AAC.1